ncbi:MAG: MOSC domain-containing protein [Pseudomonadota bacterium]
MSATLVHIFRHPIKGIGSEPLQRATLSPERALHGDRAWALLNAAAPDTDDWQPRRNFLQVASGPALAPITAASEGEEKVCLSHPERDDLVLSPAKDASPLAAWLEGLWPSDRPGPGRLVRAPGHGMTDMAEPYVSVGSLSALAELSERAGQALDMRRFRINLWVDGLAPWSEFELIGKTFHIGEVEVMGAEPIGRCRAPEANPATGLRDAPTNQLLQDGWGHTNFGIYIRVAQGGDITVGAPVTLP